MNGADSVVHGYHRNHENVRDHGAAGGVEIEPTPVWDRNSIEIRDRVERLPIVALDRKLLQPLVNEEPRLTPIHSVL